MSNQTHDGDREHCVRARGRGVHAGLVRGAQLEAHVHRGQHLLGRGHGDDAQVLDEHARVQLGALFACS